MSRFHAAMNVLNRVLFGDVGFSQSEELEEFRYKFLIILMLSGALFTLFFVVGEFAKINRIQTPHLMSMQLFTASALTLWWALRGRKHWFLPVAWIYEIVCLLEYTSALWLVPSDELRILWFFVNIPGVFILLGGTAGWVITAVTIAWLLISNAWMPVAYSANAMATAAISMLYLGVFFHAYGARSLSYFVRMQTYNKTLEQLATHDTLTGVFNARAYYAICEQSIEVAKRAHKPYCVLFVDLDYFKRVNDTYGHAAGDAVLKAVASCLKAHLRKSDVLGRIGGEEFSIYLPETSGTGGIQIAESLRKAIERLHPSIGERTLPVTASIGVASCERIAVSMQELQANADSAMYTAKAQGRNRVSVFEPPECAESGSLQTT